MVSKAVLEIIKGYVPEENIYLKEPLAKYTTFRVGGPAECMIDISSTAELQKLLHYLNLVELPYFVMGNGSNILAGDPGYQGIVLRMGNKISGIRVEGTRVIAQAGALMSAVARVCLEAGLTGFEFAAGIPGSIGGGVVMNAGAYGGEMKQVVKKVCVLTREGEALELDNETMEFGYRTSAIREHPFLVTEVELELRLGDREEIRSRMEELAARRREKQPLEYPSAGSTFKRPEGYFAGELIMKAGFRGFQIGGARVSDKHCGFVINAGGASAEDILDVMHEVQAGVKEKFGVSLEPEVVFMGR